MTTPANTALFRAIALFLKRFSLRHLALISALMLTSAFTLSAFAQVQVVPAKRVIPESVRINGVINANFLQTTSDNVGRNQGVLIPLSSDPEITSNATFELPRPLSRILFQWMNGNYNYTTLGNGPSSYRIEVSSDSTNGSNGTWPTANIGMDNPVTNQWLARSHLITGNNIRWIRFVNTSGREVGISEIDIHDLSQCSPGAACDTWGFIGDSITALAFGRPSGMGTPFNTLVRTYTNQDREPSMINFGIGGENASGLRARLQTTINNNPGIHFWAIGIGTNNGGNIPSELNTLRNDLTAILETLLCNGKQPVLAEMPYNGSNLPASDTATKDKNAVIRSLQNYTSSTCGGRTLPGPDLYTYFAADPENRMRTATNLHPADGEDGSAGREHLGVGGMNQLWAVVAANISYGGGGDQHVSPNITSANSTTVTNGIGGTFTVTATGTAPISYSLTNAPTGVSINSNSGVITIAATTAVGTHRFTIRASNPSPTVATMEFTLTVNRGDISQTCTDGALLDYFGKNRLMIGAQDENRSFFQGANAGLTDVRYRYIADMVSLGDGPCMSCADSCSSTTVIGNGNTWNTRWWGCWTTPAGQFLRNFLSQAEADGQIPMITYYTFYQTASQHPQLGGNDPNSTLRHEGNLAPLTMTNFLPKYFNDFRFMLQQMGDRKAILHIEPDLWGYGQQRYQSAPYNGSPSNIPAIVTQANPTDCAGFENSFAGFSRCLISMVRKYAPNTKVGLHASAWTTGTDLNLNRNSSINIESHARQTGNYLKALGSDETDFMVVEASDRDAGYYQTRNDCRGNPSDICQWWDENDQRLPHFEQHFRFTRELGKVVGKPLVWWQLPVGNRGLNNTNQRYQDNRVDYLLTPANADKIVDMGGILLAFGAGAGDQTNPSTDNGNLANRIRQYKQSAAGRGYCDDVPVQSVPPTITSGGSTTVTSGTGGTFQVTASGTTPITYSLSGSVPNGVTINSSTGLITIAASVVQGTYQFTINASNGALPNATRSFTLTVNAALVAPTITSANSTTVTSGVGGTFQVTATGNPSTFTFSLQGQPAGVTINSNTGLITIAATTAVSSHTFTVRASNNVSPAAAMNFTLTVNPVIPPTNVITSPNNTSVVSGTGGTFQVTATGNPNTFTFSLSGQPAGVSINASTGLMTIAGSVTAETYPFTITASNGSPPAATMSFTLTVTQNTSPVAPSITSGGSTTVTSGTAGTFQVTASGTAPIEYSLSGQPAGVSINGSTGLISIAGSVAVGAHPFTITASNAASTAATMNFTLTVTPIAPPVPPSITSANSTTVMTGTGGKFQVTAAGTAPISYSLSGQPAGVSINSASGSMTIAGSLPGGTYPFTITASNDVSPAATMNFTLMVVHGDPVEPPINPEPVGCGISDSTNNRIQRAYIAFFNRPADVPGLNHWREYPGDAEDLLTEFSQSAEYLSDYAGLSNRMVIAKVYKNLFGRAPETEGLNYWSKQMDAGWVTVANAAYEILGGARNEDKTIIENKVCAANVFTGSLKTTQEIEAYNKAGPIGLANTAKDWLALVNEHDESVDEAKDTLSALVDKLVNKWNDWNK